MKTILILPPAKYAIPDGEGFIALPISFIIDSDPVLAPGVGKAIRDKNMIVRISRYPWQRGVMRGNHVH
jgi:hypothetical protein